MNEASNGYNMLSELEESNTIRVAQIKVVRISMLEAITYMMSRSDESAGVVKRMGYGRLAELMRTTPVVELIFPAEGTEREIKVS